MGPLFFSTKGLDIQQKGTNGPTQARQTLISRNFPVPTNPSEILEDTAVIYRLVRYNKENDKDLTKIILNAFVKYLPPEGSRNLCDDIIERNSDAELSENLETCILIPSEYPYP